MNNTTQCLDRQRAALSGLSTSYGNGLVATSVKPQTQVESYSRQIEEQIEVLDKALQDHADKILPILSPEAPQDAKTANSPAEEMLCPAADRLRSYVKRMMQLRFRLEELTSRVEA